MSRKQPRIHRVSLEFFLHNSSQPAYVRQQVLHPYRTSQDPLIWETQGTSPRVLTSVATMASLFFFTLRQSSNKSLMKRSLISSLLNWSTSSIRKGNLIYHFHFKSGSIFCRNCLRSEGRYSISWSITLYDVCTVLMYVPYSCEQKKFRLVTPHVANWIKFNTSYVCQVTIFRIFLSSQIKKFYS